MAAGSKEQVSTSKYHKCAVGVQEQMLANCWANQGVNHEAPCFALDGLLQIPSGWGVEEAKPQIFHILHVRAYFRSTTCVMPRVAHSGRRVSEMSRCVGRPRVHNRSSHDLLIRS